MVIPKESKSGGVALFIAVIVASLVLTIGLSMANIFVKEYQLSVSARESQIAFYAADSGLECGIYWDTRTPDSFFGSSTDPNNSIDCNGEVVGTATQTNPPYSVPSVIGCYDNPSVFNDCPGQNVNGFKGQLTSVFTLSFGVFPTASCAVVTVRRGALPNDPSDTDYDNDPTDPSTVDFDDDGNHPGYYFSSTIESRGYNTCADTPRRIERGVRVQ